MLVAGDLFSELARPDGLREAVRHIQATFEGFLRDGGAILAVTGNHDNENFCQTLRHAMTLAAPTIGEFGSVVPAGRLYLAAEPGFLRLRDLQTGSDIQFVMMPYPTPSRFLTERCPARNMAPFGEKNRYLQAAFNARLRDIRADSRFDARLPTVLMAHVSVRGTDVSPLFRISESENVVVDAEILHANYSYVALGHIHKPHAVGGHEHVRFCGSIDRMDLGEQFDNKGVVVFELTPNGLVAAPATLPISATPMYEVDIHDPQSELPALRDRYRDHETALVNLHVRYTAGVDSLESILQELDAIFPRWYGRDWTERNDLGPALTTGAATPSKSFEDTVREYLETELQNHENRAAVLDLAAGAATRRCRMIPRRISLRGFLCYRDEQEVEFAGATLWMLGGPNGSGKSAIFDAVTYALFGYHRGGSQEAAELVNKDAEGFQVEFDFALDGELYRAKRTIRKTNRGGTTATQGIYREQSSAARPGKWEPIPDTNRKAEYDGWIREHLGLSYETFTSSVLLLQGRAEKLLDSKPKGRFEVLASIVDLERYQRLHAKVDDRRRELKANSEAIGHRLDAVAAVSDDELATADERHRRCGGVSSRSPRRYRPLAADRIPSSAMGRSSGEIRSARPAMAAGRRNARRR